MASAPLLRVNRLALLRAQEVVERPPTGARRHGRARRGLEAGHQRGPDLCGQGDVEVLERDASQERILAMQCAVRQANGIERPGEGELRFEGAHRRAWLPRIQRSMRESRMSKECGVAAWPVRRRWPWGGSSRPAPRARALR